MDVFTLLGGKDWLKALPLVLDGSAQRNEVRFAASAGKANRVTVRRVVGQWETVYEVTWFRVDERAGEADELHAAEADTAAEAADLVAASLRVREKPLAAPAA